MSTISYNKGLQLIDGTNKTVRLMDSDSLWAILDLLKDELLTNNNEGFYHNRTILTDGFRDNKLYMLTYDETDELFNNLEYVQLHRLKNTFDTLPCFCLLDNKGEIDIIWTHKPYRKHGFAKCFINHFYANKVKHVNTIIPQSLEFWKYMGFQYERI